MTVERSQLYNGTTMLLHYHNGSTCHGSPSAQDCADEERTSAYQGTVTPIRVFVEGNNLVQEFEYIDGPDKGKRFKITTKKG